MDMTTILVAALAIVPQPQKVTELGGTTAATNVTEVADATIPPEGYRLTVGTGGVTVASSDAAGAFYARQTLGQLSTSTASLISLPCVEIEDAPRFGWRGLLIDECRHFFGKETIKAQLDLMAMHKLNVLHWHLTDDQGWRLDIPAHPELVKYGATRRASPKFGVDGSWKTGDYEIEMNDERYGPFFYTEADVREILEYAAARHIRIVPEIELPGHIRALLAAHPEFACRPENLADRSPRLKWCVEKDVLCPGNDAAIRFMEEVLDYVCRLFPSEAVHIGGDECPHDRWKECAKCKARVAAEGLKDADDLQPWLSRHFANFLAARGKRAIGWDCYLVDGDMPKTAMGMSWRINRHPTEPWASSGELAARGYDLVLVHAAFCYLNCSQGLKEDPFPYFGEKPLPLAKCYSYDPLAGIAEDDRRHVLGGQGASWPEYTWNRFDLEWKVWPRLCALAEVFWTGESRPGFDDFKSRMAVHRPRLIARRVNCAPME